MSGPGWVVIALLTGAPLVMAGWTWRARRRRTLTREQKLAAARKAARGLRRTARRAGPGLSDTESARPTDNWSSFLGGPPSDVGGGTGWI
ncbi:MULTISPECIES: hypothetical protein [Micromonospora]|uniref:Uncharacterized protein n=1 Tax=Micromonospora sicca TaxID=2202420 RepID=A0A317D607_9ACTN|nr:MULTISPECIES: hypothetical protein [unclassified Micromonospora]MBM0230084.1 hypothetical protein [Micromonospora sp. ATA51]PWR10077.1 hypothetical protein DKT69_29730 [Micromonospora sp. 4G51]